MQLKAILLSAVVAMVVLTLSSKRIQVASTSPLEDVVAMVEALHRLRFLKTSHRATHLVKLIRFRFQYREV